jgi:F420-dependent oxidoreductase-like protein
VVFGNGDRHLAIVFSFKRSSRRGAQTKIGSTLGALDSPNALAQRARALEGAGVDSLWVGEAYGADSVSTLGFLAAETTRATLGSSILPIYSRTPALLAMTAVGLDRLSDGRFILGLGASGPQVVEGFHGVPYDHPLERTREIIEICRSVWRRDRLVHDGGLYRVPLAEGTGLGQGKALKISTAPVRDRIPIYVASLGPKNVELTAELAEGWLPLHFWPDRADLVWGSALRAGLARRPAELPPLEIVAGGPLAIGNDVEHLRDQARSTLAFYFGGMGSPAKNFYNDVLRRYGFEKEADEIQAAFLGGDRRAAESLVPEDLVEGLSLVGDIGFVKDRIAAFEAAGVTVLDVQPIGPNGLRDVETIAGWLK